MAAQLVLAFYCDIAYAFLGSRRGQNLFCISGKRVVFFSIVLSVGHFCLLELRLLHSIGHFCSLEPVLLPLAGQFYSLVAPFLISVVEKLWLSAVCRAH